ncbi:MAG TPA: tetratricopeptide repeat protein [Dongiaceae bacterium]|nr:tetratricopeptide repeat protein [Dongiaceae bacterium]
MRIAAVLAPAVLGACATPSSNTPAPAKEVSADSLVKAGDDARSRGDLASAALLYERAEQMNPKDLGTSLRLGGVWAQVGQPGQALEAYRRALAIDPGNAEAVRGVANTQLQMGDAAAAIATLRNAPGLRSDWRLQNSLGVAYDLSGDFQDAQAAYRQGLALAPGNLQLVSNLGLSLALAGNFDEALPMLEKAAQDPAATPRIRQNLALAYGLAGDDAKAAEIAKIDLDPAKVQANLGYYEYLRLLHDRKALAAAVGAHQAESPQ